MKFSLIAVLFFWATCSFAQEKIVGVSFLKDNGDHVTNKDSADYFHLVSVPDSGSTLYNVAEYYKNGQKKLIGKSTSTVLPVYEGQCVTFYKNGSRESMATYKNGLPVGDEYQFFPNGKIYLQKEYPDNGNRYNDIEGDFLIKANFDSLGTALVTDGNGYYRGYDAKFSYVEEEGAVKDGKRDGVWKGTIKKTNLSYSENYENGILIDGSSTGQDGMVVVYTKRGVPPQYKGGLDAFYQYLSNNIVYPTDARENNVQGRVIIGFVVEKDGTVSNVHIIRSVSPSLDAEAVRVIKKMPKWEAGVQFGRKVRVQYSAPISFALNGN